MIPFFPRSPYGLSKLAGIWIVCIYGEAYKLYMCDGILFNHEFEVWGLEFTTRKISRIVAKIHHWSKEAVLLGNLSAVKDWDHASDYVDGMWKMMLYDYPGDFVLGTGELHTVREFTEMAFKSAGIVVEWQGSGINGRGIDKKSREVVASVSKEFSAPLSWIITRGIIPRLDTFWGENRNSRWKGSWREW